MNATLWVLAGPIKRYMALSVALGLLVTFAYIGQGVLAALALSAISAAQDYERALWCVAALGGRLVVRGVLIWLQEVAAQKTAQATKESLRQRLLAKLLDLGPAFVTAQKSGEIQAVIVNG